MQWACVLCRTREQSTLEPTLCDRCGALNTFAREQATDSIESATELLKRSEFPKATTGDTNLDGLLEGGLVKPSTVIVWGRGGSGKSRVTLRWASGLSQALDSRALIMSLEMASPLCAFTAQSAGADISRLDISESIVEPSRDHRVIVLDSLTILSDDQAKLVAAKLKSWTEATGGIALVIVQVLKSGEYAGRGWVRHWPDYEFRTSPAKKVKGARVSVLKSRYCPLDSVVVPLVRTPHLEFLPETL